MQTPCIPNPPSPEWEGNRQLGVQERGVSLDGCLVPHEAPGILTHSCGTFIHSISTASRRPAWPGLRGYPDIEISLSPRFALVAQHNTYLRVMYPLAFLFVCDIERPSSRLTRARLQAARRTAHNAHGPRSSK